MTNIKTIVVPIDFSEYSPRILECSAEVAKRNSAEIVAVHVIDKCQIDTLKTVSNYSNPNTFSVEVFLNEETKRLMDELNNLVNQWVEKQVTTKTLIKSGVPYEEILRVVDDEKADLLVINSKERTSFEDYIFGTTSEKIFRHSPVSILSLNLRTL